MGTAYHRLGAMLDDMIEFAHGHNLSHVVGVLARAKPLIRDHPKIPPETQDDMTEERTLREVLDDMIDYCRQHRMEEVVDHLMEAQMAWSETHPTFGENVVAFSRLPKNRDDMD